VVLPEEGGPRQLTIARFGNVYGYGIDSAGGTCYYLRQTGRLGSERFAVEKIAAPQLSSRLLDQFPKWLSAGRVHGNVLMEVMQNDQARMLIAGKRQSTGLALYESFAKGGWVMIPLLMLPFWVAYLMTVKIVQYTGRGRLLKAHYVTAMRFLDKKDFAGALAWSKGCKNGIMARIVQCSLERKSQGRETGERAVYELLSLEAPPLRRNLNTLAVIAGAAPLLGLLGTISGMITLFAAVTHYGTGDPKFLAGGISEALITAKTGLAIAIPVLFIHDLLRAAKDRLMADLENDTIVVLNAVYPED
jgi:biopolymer transport protein ExbB